MRNTQINNMTNST